MRSEYNIGKMCYSLVKMKTFFSIVIPTLNEERYLPLLLNDLKNQKKMNFEVIITDGNSEDKTKEAALKFKSVMPLSFFKNERKNVSYQRNFGAREAKGTYLVFLDADARIKPSFSKILQRFIEQKKGLVFIPYNLPSEHDPEILLIYRLINFLIEFSLNTSKPFTNMGMIWEHNFFNAIGGFDESLYLAEDHEIIQKAETWGVRAKFAKKVSVIYSLRRMKREGRWQMYYKYIIATAHILLKGNIKNKIFTYNMGGVSEVKNKDAVLSEQNFKSNFQKVKQFFKKNLT